MTWLHHRYVRDVEPDGLDWDVLTRVAAEGFGLSLAAAPLGSAPSAPTAADFTTSDGALVADTPRLVLVSGVRIDGQQLAWVLARWPVLRRNTPCVWLDVVSVADTSTLSTFWFSLPVSFPPALVAVDGSDES